MAKIMYGSLAGAVSGKLGNTVFSHGRYGPYVWNHTIPTLVQNQWTLAAREILVEVSQAWGALTDAQRLAWETWATTHPITDRLGQKQVLAGSAAYSQINARILVGAGTAIDVPPTDAPPPSLTACVGTFDIGLVGTEIAYTVTPLAAGHCLYVKAAVLNSAGARYFANKLKLVDVTAAAAASPYDYQAAVEARFGPLVVGQRVVLLASVLDNTTGLISAPSIDQGVIVETA